VSRENFNRQLSTWRDSGIVSLRGGRILIHALQVLESLAGEPA
jgi:CRP-like cAMP-binding protein